MADFSNIRFQPNRPLLRELSADRLNTILQEIKRNKPKGERGITVRQDGTGTYIGLAALLGNGKAPATPQPWEIIPRRDSNNENQYLLTVRPGTLNNILPSNWDDEFTCAATGLFYAKAVISTDGYSVTGVTVEIDANAPVEQAPVKFALASSVEYLFGLFSNGLAYRVIGAGHINVPTRTWLVTNASPAAQPGQSPYDIYYVLGP